MAQVPANVRVAVTGAVSLGNVSATAPTSHESALTNYTDLGGISDAGVTWSTARESNDIKFWQNGATARTVVTGGTVTVKLVLLETKKEVIELRYAGTVDTDDGSIVEVPTKTPGRKKMIFDTVDGEDAVRAYAPAAELTLIGDEVWQNGQPIGYDCTFTCYADPSIVDEDGNNGSVKRFYSALVVTP